MTSIPNGVEKPKVLIDERRSKPTIELRMGKRHIALDHRRGIITVAATIAAVIAIFSRTADLLGRKFVNTDQADIADIRQIVARQDSVSSIELARLRVVQDSLVVIQRQQGEVLVLLGLVSCANVPANAPQWLRAKCDILLREEKP